MHLTIKATDREKERETVQAVIMLIAENRFGEKKDR
jgi:hypothetical protein